MFENAMQNVLAEFAGRNRATRRKVSALCKQLRSKLKDLLPKSVRSLEHLCDWAVTNVGSDNDKVCNKKSLVRLLGEHGAPFVSFVTRWYNAKRRSHSHVHCSHPHCPYCCRKVAASWSATDDVPSLSSSSCNPFEVDAMQAVFDLLTIEHHVEGSKHEKETHVPYIGIKLHEEDVLKLYQRLRATIKTWHRYDVDEVDEWFEEKGGQMGFSKFLNDLRKFGLEPRRITEGNWKIAVTHVPEIMDTLFSSLDTRNSPVALPEDQNQLVDRFLTILSTTDDWGDQLGWTFGRWLSTDKRNTMTRKLLKFELSANPNFTLIESNGDFQVQVNTNRGPTVHSPYSYKPVEDSTPVPVQTPSLTPNATTPVHAERELKTSSKKKKNSKASQKRT